MHSHFGIEGGVLEEGEPVEGVWTVGIATSLATICVPVA